MPQLSNELQREIRLMLGYRPTALGGPLLPNLSLNYQQEDADYIESLYNQIYTLDQEIVALRDEIAVVEIEDLKLNPANHFRMLASSRKTLLKTLSAFLNIPIAGRSNTRTGSTAVQYQ